MLPLRKILTLSNARESEKIFTWKNKQANLKMPDWTGTRARADALTVPCAYCHAPENQPCINLAREDHPPLWHFAAHQRRIRDAAQTIPDDEVPF